jgi:hypothetical protein
MFSAARIAAWSLILCTTPVLTAGEAAPAGEGVNVALVGLGATGKGSGAPFNKDWPVNNALVPGQGRGGTMFGAPLTGGRVDITLIVPCDIVAVELVPLDYSGTRQPKSVDILFDGKPVKQAELPEAPGKPVRIAVAGRARQVSVIVTGEHPLRTLANGKPGVAWGGWSRLRVLSTTDVPALMRPVEGYQVPVAADHIATTSGTSAGGTVAVEGQPRRSEGHPCTLWDREDIAHYQAMLKTSEELRGQLANLRKALDVRMTQPVGVPPPQKDADGAWRHVSDVETLDGRGVGAIHNQLGLDIANLGTVYALTGEPAYGEFAKRILLAYADAYPNYAIGARPTFRHSPSRAFDQILGDATWIIPVARGYDLIHDLPSITAEERARIEDGLFRTAGRLIISNHALLEAPTNWSAICTSALLTIGFAIDDRGFVDTALYGIKGTADKPTGGLLDRHFSAKAIDVDGMWGEGAIHYQFMAMQALVLDAEVLWHHGMDLWRHRDGVLKRLFDSPLQFAYPDLTAPATNDTSHGSIVGHDAFLYEYAYRRYRDPAYLAILDQCGRHLATNFQEFPVSVLYDRDRQARGEAVECKSVNFFGVGMGILRTTTESGTSSLLLKTSPNRSHGHPDKLGIDLYAFNDQLAMDPGVVWYEQPLYRQWFHTTLAHNTLVVDEQDQVMSDGQQLVYAPGTDLGMMRGSANAAYPGVTMDRSLFLTPEYVADLFAAFGRLPRTYDLAWHLRGEFASALPLTGHAFPEPVANGYCALTNLRRGTADGAWSATVTRAGNTARLFAAGAGPTEVLVGDGVYKLERPPTIIERRRAASTVYGNVLDVSNAPGGFVRAVAQEGGLEAGFGLLSIETARGTDRCLAAFRPGTHRAGGIETDAVQAQVRQDGGAVQAMILAGGTRLACAGVVLGRSAPGIASLERLGNGAYLLANPSPSAAVVSVTAPFLAGLQAFVLDGQERRSGAAAVTATAPGALSVSIPAAGRVEFAAPGAASVHDYRQGVLARRQAEQAALLAKARNECLERTRAREAEAQAHPAPAGTVLVVAAPAFAAEGGGAVRQATTKRGSVGTSFSGWDAIGHWLEWEVNVPAAGAYHLSLCYCGEQDQAQRLITVNGQEQEPFAPLVLAATGGWSNSSDDWRLATAANPAVERPLLLMLKAGANRIRLTNSNGRGANLNYLAITSPDVRPTRELLAAKLAVPPPAAP